MPHLDAAFNLVRWLTGNTADAEECGARRLSPRFPLFRHVPWRQFRVWLLTIVRNSFLDWLKDTRSGRQLFQPAPADLEWTDPTPSLEAMLLDRVDSETLGTLVAQLPAE
jgi:DNA-directed RNA polymerase specialized sigma24 family protein